MTSRELLRHVADHCDIGPGQAAALRLLATRLDDEEANARANEHGCELDLIARLDAALVTPDELRRTVTAQGEEAARIPLTPPATPAACGDVPHLRYGGPCTLPRGHEGDCSNGGEWHWRRVVTLLPPAPPESPK